MAAIAPGFSVERAALPGGQAEVRIAGRVGLTDGRAFRDALRAALAPAAAGFTLDLSGVESLDGGATALLLELEAATLARGAAVVHRGAPESVQALLELYRARGAKRSLHAPPAKIGMLDQIGRTADYLLADFRVLLEYLGEGLASLGRTIARPSTMNWRDVGRFTERAGADGFPIVALISLLVGLILGFQGAIQARQFGITSAVPMVVAIGLTRVLGPLMVAIIIAGRSGAAFAAEIGTMRVNEEIDALKTMGLCPFQFLVFPRVLALLIAVPLLTLLGDAIGLLGGFLVGIFSLDLSPELYIRYTRDALTLWHVCAGLLMSVAYAVAIGVIACERGLATTGGAEGVGRATTSSVVTILFNLVVITFAFTLFYQLFDL